MTLTKSVRRYNLNDIPPGAMPTRRAIGAQWSGITLPQGGTTAIAPQARDPGPSAFGVPGPTARDPGRSPGIGPQLARDPGPSDQCCTDLRSYTQGEFRKIKQSMDSITDSMLSWKDISGLSHSDPATVVNITDFGAKGDGTTDNQPFIQNAINYLNTNFGGGICIIPQGNFKVNTPITVKGATTLVGVSRPLSVIQSLGADSKVAIYDSTSGLGGARHMSFEGFNNAAATQDTVTVQAGAVNVIFYDCVMQHGQYGLQMNGNDCSIEDCYIFGHTGCVASTGANWYLRCKLDTPFASTFGFNHSAAVASLLENQLTDTDISGTYTESLRVNDGNNNSAVLKCKGIVFSSPINVLACKVAIFVECEIGSTTFNANNLSQVIAVANFAFAATVISLAGGATKTLAGNIALT